MIVLCALRRDGESHIPLKFETDCTDDKIKNENQPEKTFNIGQKQMTNEEVLNIKEVSIYLKIPVSTLYKLIQEGKVPAIKLGKHWRFMKKDLEMLFEQKSPPMFFPPEQKQG